MKGFEFKEYVNNFFDLNYENSSSKLNEVEIKQIDIFFDSIDIIENKMEEVQNYLSTLRKLKEVIIDLDKSRNYSFELEVIFRSDQLEKKFGTYITDNIHKKTDNNLESKLSNHYDFVQKFNYRLKKIIEIMIKNFDKNMEFIGDRQEFMEKLVKVGQDSVMDNIQFKKIDEFLNFWDHKELPIIYKYKKFKESLLFTGKLFMELKKILISTNINLNDFSSFDEQLIFDVTLSISAVDRLNNENRKQNYSREKTLARAPGFIKNKANENKKFIETTRNLLLWESICKAFFENFRNYGKSLTSAQIAKLIFKDDIYSKDKNKFNRIVFSTLHRYSTNNPNRDATFFEKDLDKKRFGSFWKLADTFELEKSWSYLIQKDQMFDPEILKTNHKNFMLMAYSYFSFKEVPGLKNIDLNPRMEKELNEVFLLDELQKWRTQKSNEMNVPAYIVFKDSVLSEIAKKQPKNIKEFSKIKGVGEKKVQQFYEDIAEILKITN